MTSAGPTDGCYLVMIHWLFKSLTGLFRFVILLGYVTYTDAMPARLRAMPVPGVLGGQKRAQDPLK